MTTQGYWKAGAIETPPDTSTLTSKGYPTSGDPTTGTPATKPGAAWYYLQDQMRNTVIEAAGQTLSEPPSPTQFLEALQTLAWIQDKTIVGKMLKDGEVTFAKLASAAIATAAQAQAGTASNLLMTPQTTKLLIESLKLRVPSGTIIHYAGRTVPEGWLICNGATVSRKTYADLYAAIGTIYGAGDGATTFNLPNLNARFLECTTSTSDVGTYKEAGLPNITGTVESGDGPQFKTWTGAFSEEGVRGWHGDNVHDYGGCGFGLSASRSSNLYGNSASVQPTSMEALALIKL